MYFLSIGLGLLLAMSGKKRTAFLHAPIEGLEEIVHEALDLFLTVSLTLALWSLAGQTEAARSHVQEYAILIPGVLALLLSRYQKKPDGFFWAAFALAFMVRSAQQSLPAAFLLAIVASAGIAVFQACFLGLRYRLLFSFVPVSMKGWPFLYFLAGFISLVLRGLKGVLF